jgi:hypothetical protein
MTLVLRWQGLVWAFEQRLHTALDACRASLRVQEGGPVH